jgi:hypothetical protein
MQWEATCPPLSEWQYKGSNVLTILLLMTNHVYHLSSIGVVALNNNYIMRAPILFAINFLLPANICEPAIAGPFEKKKFFAYHR